jgi:hypothetical protein
VLGEAMLQLLQRLAYGEPPSALVSPVAIR